MKKLKIGSGCEAIKINSPANLWITRATDNKLYDSFKENYTLKESICPSCKEINKRAKDSPLIYNKTF